MAPAFFVRIMHHKWFLTLPMIVFLVSCLDLWATLYFSKICNHFEEANPITMHVWKNHNEIGLSIFKIIVTTISCLSMGFVLKYKNKYWKIAVSIFGLTVCLLLVCWWFCWLIFFFL